MKTTTQHHGQKQKFNTILALAGTLLVMVAFQAKAFDPSKFPINKNFKQQPQNLVMPNNKAKFNLHKLRSLKANTKGSVKGSAKKPIVQISTHRGKHFFREADYFKNDEIVIPFYASLAYDSEGYHLKGSSLVWSYRKKGGAWKKFGIGLNPRLELRPDSTPYVHNHIYKVNIRLVGKNPKNTLKSTASTTISVQALLK